MALPVSRKISSRNLEPPVNRAQPFARQRRSGWGAGHNNRSIVFGIQIDPSTGLSLAVGDDVTGIVFVTQHVPSAAIGENPLATLCVRQIAPFGFRPASRP